MTWRNNLVEASFRGAKFFVSSHDYGVGRRNVVHKYPFQDEAYVEDLGRDTDEFSITGYVLQKPPLFNYFKDRDKLIDALKEEGPGTLVHRYLGEKRVALIGKAKITESVAEGGIARFSMTFVEAGKNQYPELSLDPKGLIDSFGLDAINRAIDVFADAYDTAQSVVDDINSSIQMMKTTIRTIKNIPASVISTALGLLTNAQTLIASVLNSPCDLASAIAGSLDAFTFAAGMTGDAVDRAISGCSERVQNKEEASRASDQLDYEQGRSISIAVSAMSKFGAIIGVETISPHGGGLNVITVNSPITATKQSNRQHTTNLIRIVALSQACRIAARATFESQQEVEALYSDVVDAMDEQLEYLGEQAGDSSLVEQGVAFSNDEMYQGLKELKPVFKQAMDLISDPLAKKVEFEVGNDVLTSLKLAYDKYFDLDRESEIINKNKNLVLHPGFLPNGKTIDILSE